jgi:hypothetical protein
LVAAVREGLANVRETSYRHHAHIDPANGTYQLDCSEFVSVMLERVAPNRYHQIPAEPGRLQPRAVMYFQFFGSGAILFQVDDRGSPIAFQFNSTLHWHYEPIAIARLVPIDNQRRSGTPR